MKLDEKGIDAGASEITSVWAEMKTPDQRYAAEMAVQAYIKATDSEIVPSETVSSAVALLTGLSIFWLEQGDRDQSRHVAKIAKALNKNGKVK